jgi:anionic cell wall polymer biosynthesis LytR-Cps2A-Psr (LCP) family protein
MGTVKLIGSQAVSFVRSRAGVGDQLNLSRIDRQQAYAQGFMDAFDKKQAKGTGFLLDAYEQASPYLITDCSVATVNAMVERYGHYKLDRILTPPGENVMGEQYYEFHIDEKGLEEMVLDLFYAEKVFNVIVEEE